MTSKIARTDTDFNTIQWQDQFVAIARESDSHVRISRYKHRPGKPSWTISIDAISGYRMLHVAHGNRLACLNNQHLLALTAGTYGDEGSLHNHQLHYIHHDGQVVWSRPWQTIQRFTVIGDKLLILRYINPPHFWIEDAPLEAHLLDVTTGASCAYEPIAVPEPLREHYQSWQVTELKTYLVWKDDKLVVTVRPYFRPDYAPAQALTNRGSFKHVLSFNVDNLAAH